MRTPKPPLRCPACGCQLAELTKQWEARLLPRRKLLRYPIAIVATYLCGARIESRFEARPSFTGHVGYARWIVQALTGCRYALDEQLTSTMPEE